MNKLTKQRYISTSIWSDEWFDSLTVNEKLVYFNLLTNDHTNPAGVYPFALKYCAADTGLSRDEVNTAMKTFEKAGKAFLYKEYMIVPKWLKHQKISARSKMFLGALAVLRSLPPEIKIFISTREHYDFPIEKFMEIPKFDSLPIAYTQKHDSLSIGYTEKGDSLYPKTVYPINSLSHDSDSDFDSDFDIDSENYKEGQSELIPDFDDVISTPEQLFDPDQETPIRFKKPSVDEVCDYCTERGNGIDPEAFINFYASKGWKVGKTPMKDWKAAVRTWERRQSEEKKASKKIANDNVDDVSKYFSEI
jgi:hypothetical protein